MMSTAGVLALSSGLPGLALGYGVVQASVIAGLSWGSGRAKLRKLLWSPFMSAGMMLASGAAMSLAKPLILGLGVANGGLAHFGIALAVHAAMGYVGGRLLDRANASTDVYRRGTVVYNREQSEEIKRKRIKAHAHARGADAPITIAGIPLSREDETQHFKFVGITGTGKTTAIKEVVAAALARGDRAIIVDPEGTYSKAFYNPERGDVIFNPFDNRSPNWDLFAEIKSEKDIHELAYSLIPETGHAADREWREYARTFFISVTQKLWELDKFEKENNPSHASDLTVQRLYDILTTEPIKKAKKSDIGLEYLLEGTPAETFIHEENAKMFGSVRAITGSALRAFSYLNKPGRDRFSVREWVKQGSPGDGPDRGGVLFIPYRSGEISALKSIISTWMRLGIFESMEKDENQDQRLWFVMDELAALDRIHGLEDGITRLRKFGGRVVLGFQSIDQVEGIYGKSAANPMIENCGNSLILRCGTGNDGGTSRFAAHLIGQRDIVRTTSSVSRRMGDWFGSTTRSEHYTTEAAVMDSEIEQLENMHGFLRIGSERKWMQIKLEHKDYPPSKALASESGSAAATTADRPNTALLRAASTEEYKNKESDLAKQNGNESRKRGAAKSQKSEWDLEPGISR